MPAIPERPPKGPPRPVTIWRHWEVGKPLAEEQVDVLAFVAVPGYQYASEYGEPKHARSWVSAVIIDAKGNYRNVPLDELTRRETLR